MWESYSHTRRELRSVKNARSGHVQCFKMGGCFCRAVIGRGPGATPLAGHMVLGPGQWLLYRKNYPAGQDFLTFQRDARNVEFCATYLKCQRQQLVYQKSNVKQNPLAVVSL